MPLIRPGSGSFHRRSLHERLLRMTLTPLAGRRVTVASGTIVASAASSSRYWRAIVARIRRRLHQGEIVADADPRTAAEGEIGVAVNPLKRAVSPALGTKRLGIVEPAAIAMDHPLGHEYRRPSGDRYPPSSTGSIASRPIIQTGRINPQASR